MSALFSGPAPRVRATLSSAPFLDVFVEAMVSELYDPNAPFALADALIFMPNRRAAAALIDAFAERLGGAALLPAIRALGDLEDDPEIWGAETLALEAAPAIDPMERRLTLASLIRAWEEAASGAADPVRALAFADELCALLDSAAASGGVDWEKLSALAREGRYAAHWLRSAEFLGIITLHWPAHLTERGLADPGARRAHMLHALAAQWERAPPQRPIVIAGSTGSVQATRVLMKAAARAPRGAVLLPGLDVDLDARAWEKISAQHPQYALRETLTELGLSRADVGLVGGAEGARAKARRILIREALAPADMTADWRARLQAAGGPALAAAGARDLTLYEAETVEEEASVIALLLRGALEEEGVRAALATPDANLARRVEAKLARWGVRPQMTQGRLLETSASGVLLALLAQLALDEGEPVALSGLVRHELAAFGMRDGARIEAATALEHGSREVIGLKGPRRHDDLADLATKAAPEARTLIEAAASALEPLRALRAGEVTLARFADAIAASAENVAARGAGESGQRAWAGADGAAASRFLKSLIENGAALGAASLFETARAFAQALSEQQLPPAWEGDGRIAIFGPLEARLQQRDLVILGALNEGVWPAAPREDPFLSRAMRAEIGLPDPDVRLGLAAHDFEQLANAPRVVLTRAKKRDGSPTVASRWVWRLKTLLRAAAGDALIAPAPDSDARVWARGMDRPREAIRIAPPRPILQAPLVRLSVTDVETLVRDPYALYAKRVLGLQTLDPIGKAPDASERGSAVHSAIEHLPAGAGVEELADRIDAALAAMGFTPAQRAADRARTKKACARFFAWLEARRAAGAQVFLERKGKLLLPSGAELSCQADRIEVLPNGRALIVDYKTGAPPSDKTVHAGLAPQLLLEGAIVQRGQFEGVPAAEPEGFLYWHFGSADPGVRIVALDAPAQEASETALRRLYARLAEHAAGRPFPSKPHVQFASRYDDYDLLARRKEWVDAGDEP